VVALGFLFVTTPSHIWLVYLSNGLLSLGSTLFQPAYQAILPALAKPEQLHTANALLSSTSALMTILGAALVGATIASLGPEAAFVFNAFSFLVAAAGDLALRVREPRSGGRSRTDIGADLLETTRMVRGNPLLTGIILVSACWASIGGGYYVILSTFGARVFSLSSPCSPRLTCRSCSCRCWRSEPAARSSVPGR
jgi:MFS family permease